MHVLTYTGVHVTREFGAPTLRDIAVQTMRLFRFAGSGKKCWPVGMHLLLVADLANSVFQSKDGCRVIGDKSLEHHALLHDAAEAAMNDCPRPMKTVQAKKLEARITERIYHSLGLKLPTLKEAELIHTADMRAVQVEGRAGYGPRGYEQTQPNIDYNDNHALNLFHWYEKRFNPAEALDADSYWPLELERRLRIAVTRAHNRVKLIKQYTKAA